MQICPLKSKVIKPNTDLISTIWQIFKKNKFTPKNGDILVISSKIIAICQGLLVTCKNEAEFRQLVKQEADMFLGGQIPLTMKGGILIPQAGIDRSNVPQGMAVLWPKNPWNVAEEAWKNITKRHRLKKFGVVVADSRCTPLRWGTTGLALSWFGFHGVEDIRGKRDIFKKPLKVTKQAVADNLVSAALLLMGEAGEKIPMAIARGIPVKFDSQKQKMSEIFIKPKDCLFAPVYRDVF